MTNLRDTITAVLKEHPEIDFRFCRVGQHEAVLDAIAERFLVRGRRDLDQVWIHNCFHGITGTYQPPNLFTELRKRLDADTWYWLLASDENGKYWVAEATGAAVVKVIGETPFFEYYIIDRKMTWILCEDHHNMLIEARAKSPGDPLSQA